MLEEKLYERSSLLIAMQVESAFWCVKYVMWYISCNVIWMF